MRSLQRLSHLTNRGEPSKPAAEGGPASGHADEAAFWEGGPDQTEAAEWLQLLDGGSGHEMMPTPEPANADQEWAAPMPVREPAEAWPLPDGFDGDPDTEPAPVAAIAESAKPDMLEPAVVELAVVEAVAPAFELVRPAVAEPETVEPIVSRFEIVRPAASAFEVLTPDVPDPQVADRQVADPHVADVEAREPGAGEPEALPPPAPAAVEFVPTVVDDLLPQR